MGYVTRQCEVKDLQRDLQKLVKRHVPVNEQITVCLETRYEPKSSIWTSLDEIVSLRFRSASPHYSAYLITDSRFACIEHSDKSIIDYKLLEKAESFQLGDILGIQEDNGELRIRSHGDAAIRCQFETTQQLQEFALLLRQAVEQAKHSRAQHDSRTEDAELRLKNLDRLLRSGLISNDEYQQKRRDILDQL